MNRTFALLNRALWFATRILHRTYIDLWIQLHCLNTLRLASCEDYYKYKAEPRKYSPRILRHHLGESRTWRFDQGLNADECNRSLCL